MAEVNEEICNWCGDLVSLETEYSAELACGSRACGRYLYHQCCVDEHLKRQGFKSDRCTGFPCPRGLGKYMAGQIEPCRGRIDSTHKKVPCKNKKKKAAVLQAAPAQPKPVPHAKPKVPVPATAQSAAAVARIAAHLANRPTPVRGGVAPGTRAAPAKPAGVPVKQSREELMKMAAALRQEIGVGDRYEAAPAAAPAVVPRVLKLPAPGEGPNKLKLKAQVEPVVIPGMEYVEPKRKPKPAALNPAAGWQQQQFNLHEEAAAFPALAGGGAGAANAAFSNRASAQINALDPRQAGGFVNDLARYNALLGLSSDEGFDDGDDDGDQELHTPHGAGSSSAGSTSQDVAGLEDTGLDLAAIPDHILACAIQYAVEYGIEYGVEQAGLSPAYVPLVQQVLDALSEDMLQGLGAAQYQDALTAEQQAEADRAAYLAAEQVVLDAERAGAAAVEQQQGYQQVAQYAAPHVVPPQQQYPAGWGTNFPAAPSQVVPAVPAMPAMASPHGGLMADQLTHVPMFAAPAPQPVAAPMFMAPQPVALQQQAFAPLYYGQPYVSAGNKGVELQVAAAAPEVEEEEADIDVDELLKLCLAV